MQHFDFIIVNHFAKRIGLPEKLIKPKQQAMPKVVQIAKRVVKLVQI